MSALCSSAIVRDEKSLFFSEKLNHCENDSFPPWVKFVANVSAGAFPPARYPTGYIREATVCSRGAKEKGEGSHGHPQCQGLGSVAGRRQQRCPADLQHRLEVLPQMIFFVPLSWNLRVLLSQAEQITAL